MEHLIGGDYGGEAAYKGYAWKNKDPSGQTIDSGSNFWYTLEYPTFDNSNMYKATYSTDSYGYINKIVVSN